jgi:hypothetical protein
MAQYAPRTPRTTVRIAVLLIKKATKIAFTVLALAGSHPVKRAAAND